MPTLEKTKWLDINKQSIHLKNFPLKSRGKGNKTNSRIAEKK